MRLVIGRDYTEIVPRFCIPCRKLCLNGCRPARPRSAAGSRRQPARPNAGCCCLGILVLLAAAWLAGSGSATGISVAGPVILVSIDTLRADRLPVYGYKQGRTPVLDVVRKRGVSSSTGRTAHAPQTLPSHASMFTGRLPFEHKVRDNLGFTLAPGRADAGVDVSGRGLQDRGRSFRRTCCGRKPASAQGFDVYDATFPPSGRATDRPRRCSGRDPRRWPPPRRGCGRSTSDRFFLFFHIYEPHKPYEPPDRFGDLDALRRRGGLRRRDRRHALRAR